MSRKDSRLIDSFIIKALMGALIGICLILYACGEHDSLILEDKMGFIIQNAEDRRFRYREGNPKGGYLKAFRIVPAS